MKIPLKTSESSKGTSSSIKAASSLRNKYSANPMMHLQQTLGNQEVQRLYKSGKLQAALRIGRPNDVYEQEADRVAKQVMRMEAPSLSRKCARCGKEEELNIRRKPESAASDSSVPDNFVSSLGAGQTLDRIARDHFEPRFGMDFSHVRIHAGQRAAESANAINALAYTLGNNVVFGAGQYQPETIQGKRLLAHELTHVVQQSGHSIRSIQKKIEVNPGLTLDTMGYTTSKSGNVYTCPRVVKSSIWHELFTSLLFSPRIFKLKGTTNSQINSSFRKHMKARFGILDFTSKKKYIFGAGGSFRMNPDYWIVDSSGWRLKPGVDRTEAINDLNVHPEKYAIACHAATLLTMIGGGMSNIVEGSSSDISDWIPGDWGYITNTSFPPGGPAGMEGENIIYTGKDKFWGHFGPSNEYKTLTEWFNQVKSWHGSASIESTRRIPDAGLE